MGVTFSFTFLGMVITSTAEYTLLKEEILLFLIFSFVCQYCEKVDFQGSQLVLLKCSFFDCAYVLVDSLRSTRTDIPKALV